MNITIIWPPAYDDWPEERKQQYAKFLEARDRQPDPYPVGVPDEKLLADIIAGRVSPKGRPRRRRRTPE